MQLFRLTVPLTFARAGIRLKRAAILLIACGLLVTVPVYEACAGRVPMPGSNNTCVGPYGNVTYFETFSGGQLAMITLDGDGSTDLDIFVYDERNNLITFGIGPTDHEFVSFTPLWTGVFRIEVRNLGARTNCFQMSTN